MKSDRIDLGPTGYDELFMSTEERLDAKKPKVDKLPRGLAGLSAKSRGFEKSISAAVHMDEKTPHMHRCFVPLTEGKRLSTKEVVGNRKKLT